MMANSRKTVSIGADPEAIGRISTPRSESGRGKHADINDII